MILNMVVCPRLFWKWLALIVHPGIFLCCFLPNVGACSSYVHASPRNAGTTTGAVPQMVAVEPSADADPLADICDRQISQYTDIGAALERRFPKGSSVSELINYAKQRLDLKEPMNKPVVDLALLTVKHDWTRGSPEPNAIFNLLSKSCSAGKLDETEWILGILATAVGEITLIEFRPLVKNPDQFASRGVPLRFAYFSSDADLRTALWSLTGPTVNRRDVEKLMAEIDEACREMRCAGSFYASKPAHDNELQFRFERDTARLINSRLSGEEYVSIIVWAFKSDGRLHDLQVY